MSEASRAGHYFGTEVGGKWWKRYRAPGFSARGNGSYKLSSGFGFRDRSSAEGFATELDSRRSGSG